MFIDEALFNSCDRGDLRFYFSFFSTSKIFGFHFTSFASFFNFLTCLMANKFIQFLLIYLQSINAFTCKQLFEFLCLRDQFILFIYPVLDGCLRFSIFDVVIATRILFLIRVNAESWSKHKTSRSSFFIFGVCWVSFTIFKGFCCLHIMTRF